MQLFRFANQEFLYLLLLIPVIGALFIVNTIRRKKALRKFGEETLVKRLLPWLSDSRPVVKLILQLLALAAIIIALARPQYGSRLQETRKKGVEVVIALDVSNSMLSEDIRPDRLTRAKQAIERLVDRLSDDRIGLIVFAGDAYTQIPVTTDYVSAKMFLSNIGPEMVPRQGTAIGAAINLGVSSFTPGEGRSRAMIIITDGENHEDDPLSAAEKASGLGIVIHTIGIGSTDGVPVPVMNNGKRDYLKDNEGNTVISRLDEKVLQDIAAVTGGSYVRASNASIGLEEIFTGIKRMDTDELESTMYTEYNDQFRIFAVLSLILLVADFMVMDRKNMKLADIRLFRFKI